LKPEIKAYLERIGISQELKTDFASLCLLQSQHLKTVPYENLDIMRNIPLSLEVGDMYEKIVVHKRGGYCFELNGLFTWLLRGLGFKVTEYMARFLRDETEIPMRRHRVLKVSCNDGDYIADVGVGSPVPLNPLPFVMDQVSEQRGEKYKLVKEDFLGNVLYEWKREEWKKVYSFTEEEQLNIDYIMPSYYCEVHPESYFRTMDMVHMFTEDGRKSVANRELKIFSPRGVEVIVPASEEIYHQLLKLHFGIEV